ncbi:MAG: hypothetical protein ACREPL_06660 [Rhodanobacteraceae bacterium]
MNLKSPTRKFDLRPYIHGVRMVPAARPDSLVVWPILAAAVELSGMRFKV